MVLAGPPNAGKSSLFNALCRDERAIVTPVPGTTRDALAECLDIDGIPVVLVDTAGVHETRDQVERVGVERARAHIEQADLVIWLHGGDGADESIEPAAGPPVVRITSKVDLPTTAVVPGSLPASALTGQGLDELCREIVRRLCDEHFDPTALVIGRQRQLLALEAAATALDAAAAGLEAGAPPELTAVDVQEASDALGELVGLSTIEDVLDELFAEFCIGK